MVPMMATLFPMLDPLGASRNQVCFNLLLRDEIGAAASTFSESPSWCELIALRTTEGTSIELPIYAS